MENKTCGECRFLGSAKETGVCEKRKICLYPEELPACSKFEQKVMTNGDVIRRKSNEFCPYRDCEYYQAYDDGDGYPPNILCEKVNEWFDYVLPCYECEGKWSAEQICAYIAREEARLRARIKEQSK